MVIFLCGRDPIIRPRGLWRQRHTGAFSNFSTTTRRKLLGLIDPVRPTQLSVVQLKLLTMLRLAPLFLLLLSSAQARELTTVDVSPPFDVTNEVHSSRGERGLGLLPIRLHNNSTYPKTLWDIEDAFKLGPVCVRTAFKWDNW
jgi:hypothetical protein